jgi:hypothetical protein
MLRICVVWATLPLVFVLGCQPSRILPQDGRSTEAGPVTRVGAHPDLDGQLAAIMESIESARVVMRRDSGTVVADSTFIRFRRELDDRISKVAEVIDDPDFQARWKEQRRLERHPIHEEEAWDDFISRVSGAHGVWVYQAEGDTYFSADEGVLLKKLGPLLTHGMRNFLEMEVDEQRTPAADDAALVIPLDEMTRRIQWTERYLATHPESVVSDVVESKYRWYLAAYMDGLPNTPAFDWHTDELDSAWRESLQNYVTDHPGTESADLVSRYMRLLEASRFKRSAAIEAFLSELWSNFRPVQFP